MAVDHDYWTLRQAAQHVPPKGVHWMTLYRWATRGLEVAGRRIKLQTYRVSNQRFTTGRWLDEFLAAQQDSTSTRDEILRGTRNAVAAELERELK